MDATVTEDFTTLSFILNESHYAGDDFVNASSPTRSLSKSVVFPAAMFFFGVLGNVCAIVILTIRPSKDSRATAFYNLVKALVFTDLIGIVASSPVAISVYIKGGGVLNAGGMALCHYFAFILVWAGDSTMFLVLIMAGERFLVTKYPFQYSRIVRPLTVNCSILGAITVSTLMGIMPIIGVGSNTDHWPGTWCFFDFKSSSVGNGILSFFYAITALIIVIVTIVLNITVIRHLWHMRKIRLTSSMRSRAGESKHSNDGPDSERRMVIFLMAIILVFSICYVPFMVRILMNQFFVKEADDARFTGSFDAIVDLWTLRLASLNQILDPWIYIISRVTCCKGPGKSDDDLHDSRNSSPASTRRLNVHQTSTTNATLPKTSRKSHVDNNGKTSSNPRRQSTSPVTRMFRRVRQIWTKRSGPFSESGHNNDSPSVPLTHGTSQQSTTSHSDALISHTCMDNHNSLA